MLKDLMKAILNEDVEVEEDEIEEEQEKGLNLRRFLNQNHSLNLCQKKHMLNQFQRILNQKLKRSQDQKYNLKRTKNKYLYWS